MGRQLDNYYGGNPNPTFGQVYGGYGPRYARGSGRYYGSAYPPYHRSGYPHYNVPAYAPVYY